ncbi:DUF1993 family protein [Algimonas porphyrae]|uniref:DUF1993 domain-containing protein n=1 Tax=Algimonas porphyrae TaxID=1128113 RepID=A0ABQ5V0P0_9PROT|nr:DUF1993 domain-containing protein [Algimonas porphyrae]GLQ21123.1 hypothetical protein GCM10007854_20780 [Algimonas porphyrae]
MLPSHPLLVPTYTNMLRALTAWLEKSRSQLSPSNADALMSARLADDMFPLASQICFTCLQAQEPFFRLRHEPLPDRLNRLTEIGRNPDQTLVTIAAAQTYIAESLTYLDALPPDALNGRGNCEIELALPNGMTFDLSAEDYVRDWAIPQFYFHLNTAYAILRMSGVDLGKADYVAHMFSYLRS